MIGPTFFKFQPFASWPAWPALKGEGGIWARERACGASEGERKGALVRGLVP